MSACTAHLALSTLHLNMTEMIVKDCFFTYKVYGPKRLSDNINQGLKNSRHYHTKTTVSQIKHSIFHAHYLDEK